MPRQLTNMIGRTILPIVFHAIKARESAVDACANELRGAILTGKLAPGDKLPAERALADSFGVNRVTIRSALAQVANAGLLRVRQGSGYVVLDYRRRGGPDLLPGLVALAEASGSFVELAADLLLVRRHLAGAVLERLATCDDPMARRRVAATIDEFAAVVARDPQDVDAIADADMDVLSALLDATGSPVLGLCFNPILAVVSELPRLRAAIYAAPEGNVAGWRLLSDWLADPGTPPPAHIATVLAARDELTFARLTESQ